MNYSRRCYAGELASIARNVKESVGNGTQGYMSSVIYEVADSIENVAVETRREMGEIVNNTPNAISKPLHLVCELSEYEDGPGPLGIADTAIEGVGVIAEGLMMIKNILKN